MVRFVDRTTDPGLIADLAVARLGQAFFSRQLNELGPHELESPSLLPGWSRAHVIAHVGYNARAISRLVEWAETGVETPMYVSAEAREREIAFGATLSDRALRHLSDHAAVQLDVAWRDLPDDRWDATVRSGLGREIPVSETVWLRTRELWLHAIDLDNGARGRDVPRSVQRRLLEDVFGAWGVRGEPAAAALATDTGERFGSAEGANAPIRVAGELAHLMLWATGRATAGVVELDDAGRAGGPAHPAPRWI
jgi:maleylpyruvate isomerase